MTQCQPPGSSLCMVERALEGRSTAAPCPEILLSHMHSTRKACTCRAVGTGGTWALEQLLVGLPPTSLKALGSWPEGKLGGSCLLGDWPRRERVERTERGEGGVWVPEPSCSPAAHVSDLVWLICTCLAEELCGLQQPGASTASESSCSTSYCTSSLLAAASQA